MNFIFYQKNSFASYCKSKIKFTIKLCTLCTRDLTWNSNFLFMRKILKFAAVTILAKVEEISSKLERARMIRDLISQG